MAQPRLPKGPPASPTPPSVPPIPQHPLSSRAAAQWHLADQLGHDTAIAVLRAAAVFGDLAAGAFDAVQSHRRTDVLKRELGRILKAIEGLRTVAPKTNSARQALDELEAAVGLGLDRIAATAPGMQGHLLLELPPAARAEGQAFLLGKVLRRGVRQRRLFMLFHSLGHDNARHLEPLDLAAIFLCVGFPGEGPTSDTSEITKRLDLWRKARADVETLHQRWVARKVVP
ncbi:MAG: hypothetical protein Q8L14_20245 [Myxococcales bacterium]|nr:hypothetical protein [Myxococcales bacterium]